MQNDCYQECLHPYCWKFKEFSVAGFTTQRGVACLLAARLMAFSEVASRGGNFDYNSHGDSDCFTFAPGCNFKLQENQWLPHASIEQITKSIPNMLTNVPRKYIAKSNSFSEDVKEFVQMGGAVKDYEGISDHLKSCQVEEGEPELIFRESNSKLVGSNNIDHRRSSSFLWSTAVIPSCKE
eukprot:768431-Hanusia_phi.AAC.14